MRFISKGKSLYDALVLAKKFAYPISRTIIVCTKRQTYLYVEGSNVACQINVESEVEKRGAVEFNFDLLFSSIRADQDTYSYENKGSLLGIKGAKHNAEIPIDYEVEEVPSLSAPEDGIDFPQKLVVALDKLVPSITVQDSKLGMESVIFFKNQNKRMLVASASFSEASFIELKTKIKDSISFSVPSKLFSVIRSGSGRSDYSIKFNDDFMYVVYPNSVIKMPAYKSDVPIAEVISTVRETENNKPTASVSIKLDAINDALKNKTAYIESDNTFAITVEEDCLTVGMTNSTGAILETKIDITESKKSKEVFKVFPSVLMNTLKRIKSEELIIDFHDNALVLKTEFMETPIVAFISRA